MQFAINILRIGFFTALLLLSITVNALEVQMRNSTFYAPEVGPYVECNILILGSTIGYSANNNGTFQGEVEVTLLIKNTQNEILQADKYLLKTVEIADTNQISIGVVDKKRFLLANGTYILEATFVDKKTGKRELITNSISIDQNYESISLSDIDLIDEYSKTDETESIYVKSGMHLSPYVINFYPDNIDKLRYYFEFYNPAVVNETDLVLVKTSIKKSGEASIPFGHFTQRKMKLNAANSFLGEFDISNLPSGNYDLSIEVRDRENNLLTSKTMFFQRSKYIEVVAPDKVEEVNIVGTFVDTFSAEAVYFNLQSFKPIATTIEEQVIKSLLKSDDVELARKFFLNFWITRNAADPYSAWKKYSLDVEAVNFEFGTNIRYGFETDRGRIYLMYGAPSQLIDMPREPGAYPYQIWHYYGKVGNQSNVKFVFYNTDLVTNEYQLIHSNAVGQVHNDQWQRLVYGAFTGGTSPTGDGSTVPDHFGGRAGERFDE